ncbi:MAG: hypothetical protein KF681_04980 [Bdellovibrionaceae bacterium]|nr:hypothetical protein [Pseudobdellovibrionaceae bacterium]
MTPFKKALLVASVSLLLLFGLVWVFRYDVAGILLTLSSGDLKSQYESRSPEKILEQKAPLIEADRLRLAAIEFFQSSTRGQLDASTFLNPLISWPQHPGLLALPPEARKILELPPQGHFWDAQPDWKQLNLDFSWFTSLHRFDHWSFDQGGPLYDQGQDYKIMTMPQPEYADLVAWSKLRLLKGRDDKDLENAFKDVRQLAKLTMTNESLIATMIAIAMLKQETGFYAALSEEARKGLNWHPIAEEDLEAARRYFWAQPAFLDLRLSDQAFRQYAVLEPGLCQRVYETLASALAFRRLAIRYMSDAYKRLDDIEKSSAERCRPSLIRRLWNNPNYEGIFEPNQDLFSLMTIAEETGESSKIMPKVTIGDLEKHPSLAGPITYLMLSIAEPNHLRRYEDAGAQGD